MILVEYNSNWADEMDICGFGLFESEEELRKRVREYFDLSEPIPSFVKGALDFAKFLKKLDQVSEYNEDKDEDYLVGVYLDGVDITDNTIKEVWEKYLGIQGENEDFDKVLSLLQETKALANVKAETKMRDLDDCVLYDGWWELNFHYGCDEEEKEEDICFCVGSNQYIEYSSFEELMGDFSIYSVTEEEAKVIKKYFGSYYGEMPVY